MFDMLNLPVDIDLTHSFTPDQFEPHGGRNQAAKAPMPGHQTRPSSLLEALETIAAIISGQSRQNIRHHDVVSALCETLAELQSAQREDR